MDDASSAVRTRSSRTSVGSTSRLSFTGSIRLNDLLCEDEEDEYGFNVEYGEEAAETTVKKLERRPSSSFVAGCCAAFAESQISDAISPRHTTLSEHNNSVQTREHYNKVYANTCEMYEMMRSLGFARFEKPTYSPPFFDVCQPKSFPLRMAGVALTDSAFEAAASEVSVSLEVSSSCPTNEETSSSSLSRSSSIPICSSSSSLPSSWRSLMGSASAMSTLPLRLSPYNNHHNSKLLFDEGDRTSCTSSDVDVDTPRATEHTVPSPLHGTSMEMMRDTTPSTSCPTADASDSDSAAIERESIGSTHSTESVSTSQSKLGQLIDRAKKSGKKLVEKKKEKTPHQVDEALQCELDVDTLRSPTPKVLQQNDASDPFLVYSMARRCRSMPFFHHRMFLLGVLIAVTAAFPGFFVGVMWGIYVSFIGFLYFFVSDPHPRKDVDSLEEEFAGVELAEEAHEVSDASGLGEGVVYKGWMNELRSRYHPASYHVNNTQSVLVRLEGSTLRISRPAKSVLKHAFHTDPTLTQAPPTMTSQTIYDLADATVSLRPKRLAPRRWWSRKYPIHIRFAHTASALAEVDLSRTGISRSVSMHQNTADLPATQSAVERLAVDTAYDGEFDSTTDEESPTPSMTRSNSVGDLSDFMGRSKGLNRKRKGRSVYLFVRAAREKERWFHLLREACSKSRKARDGMCADGKLYKVGSLPGGLNDAHKQASRFEHEFMLYKVNHMQFAKQLLGVIGCAVTSPEPGSTVHLDLGCMKWKPSAPENNSELVSSVHAIASRIFFDFCRDKYWSRCVKEKIQAKISTVHLPYFIEKLELSSLDLGSATPSIVGVYSPKMDEWGLWVDFELRYHGCIRLVLQTSVNLLKLRSGSQQVQAQRKVSRWTDSVRSSNHSDPELPESPESSPDEDFGSTNTAESNTKERTGKKLLSIVEKAAQSSLFQKAAKLPKVAKLMEEVSSTPLMLNVAVEVVEGTMTVNLPPPPSDRLWYAFRKPPTISIKAVPQVGDRSVDMSTVSDWIEAKLRLLVEKNLVCPNMDDIILPVMSGNALLNMGYNR